MQLQVPDSEAVHLWLRWWAGVQEVWFSEKAGSSPLDSSSFVQFLEELANTFSETPPPFGAELVVPLVGDGGREQVGGDELVGVGYEEWLWAFDVGILLLGVPPSAYVSYRAERIPRAPVVLVLSFFSHLGDVLYDEIVARVLEVD